MEAFGIFEGGGVKGLAHVGALATAEKLGVHFIGVAGTSAGAIVASLLAAGYGANELYDPAGIGGKGIFDIDYLTFFNKNDWRRLKRLMEDAQGKFGRHNISRINDTRLLKVLVRAPGFYFRHKSVLRNLVNDRGVFDTVLFTHWLEAHLAHRLSLHPRWGDEIRSGCKVLFKHIDLPLKIIATDLTNQTIKVFSKEDDEDYSVAEAVAASVSIPFLFKPVHGGQLLRGQELVDGGLLSNFPAWVFDKERRAADPSTQTFGFKFITPAGGPVAEKVGLLDFAKNLALTALAGGDHLQSRQIDNLHIIPLKVAAKTTQFEIEDNDRQDLYERGRHCARDAFEQVIGWISQQDMTTLLEGFHSKLLNTIGRQDVSLRLCILLPTGVYKDHLKVIYTYNFSDLDTDDRLELPVGSGVAGTCWTSEDVAIGDMAAARLDYADTWKMTKYQQALVRPTLKSCLCVPIMKREVLSVENGDTKLIGVLSIDSDQDLIKDFSYTGTGNRIVSTAVGCSKLISNLLK